MEQVEATPEFMAGLNKLVENNANAHSNAEPNLQTITWPIGVPTPVLYLRVNNHKYRGHLPITWNYPIIRTELIILELWMRNMIGQDGQENQQMIMIM